MRDQKGDIGWSRPWRVSAIEVPIKNMSVSGTQVEFSYGEVWRGDESPLHDFKSQSYLPKPRAYPGRSHGQDNIRFYGSL